MKSLVLYHASCADGFTAAWAAWLALKDTADYRPVQYGKGVPDFTDKEGNPVEYENVYVLDFSFPAEDLVKMLDRIPGHIFLLDHHKSAVEMLQSLVDDPNPRIHVTLDMAKSGAMLAWEYFYPTMPNSGYGPAWEHSSPATAPLLVQYVQDRDLWKFLLPNSHEIRVYAETVEFDFEAWSTLDDELGRVDEAGSQVGVLDIADRGREILRYKDTLVARRAKQAAMCRLEGYTVPCVNETNFQSEVGNLLSKEHPFAVLFFLKGNGEVIYSLRSSADNPNHVDVSVIAKVYGGGGHRHAAGFRSSSLPMCVEVDVKDSSRSQETT